MKLISSYDNASDEKHVRRNNATAARMMVDAAKMEIGALAEEFCGIEDTIMDGLEDDETADWAIEFISTRRLKLEEAYRRLKHFRAELKEYGDE